MKLKDAIAILADENKECLRYGNKVLCTKCQAMVCVVDALRTAQREKRATFWKLSEQCRHAYSKGCGYSSDGGKCQLRTCPLLKGGGK